MRIKYARKRSLQLLGGRKDTGMGKTVMISPPGPPINDEARNDARIASTGVRL